MEKVAPAAASGTGGGRPAGAASGDARRSARTRTRAAAQVAFLSTVLDCVLVDASPEGARVFLLAPADVPDAAELRLPCGAGRPVRCRWQAGLLELRTKPPDLPQAHQGASKRG